MVGGKVETLPEGIKLAKECIDSGEALNKLISLSEIQ